MIATELELPMPPSINGYWRAFRGRQIISEAGREYRKALVSAYGGGQGQQFGSARLSVTLSVHAADRRRHDLDNVCKAILDGLTHCGIYDDDSQIDDLRIVRGKIEPKHPCVIARIAELGSS